VTVSLRTMIHQAVTAYEIAVATRARAERTAQRSHFERLEDLEAEEGAESNERKHLFESQKGVAAAEAKRVEIIAVLAEDLTKAAVGLLDKAALAHVRGFNAGSVGAVHAHTATDEQTAAAFAAAQVASVDLRCALLKLARAHLEDRDWKQARKVLIPLRADATGAFLDEVTALLHASYLNEGTSALHNGEWEQARKVLIPLRADATGAFLDEVTALLHASYLNEGTSALHNGEWEQARKVLIPLRADATGAFLDEVTALLHASYLNEGTSALHNGEWEQARRLTKKALKLAADEKACTQVLREVSLRETREALTAGDPEQARSVVLVWLKDHDGTEFQDLLLQATFELADQALDAERLVDASSHLSVAAKHVGGHPRLREWTWQHPLLGWASELAVPLHEFGGHRQPVQDVAFTADGSHLVSIDGADAKTWSVAGSGSGKLVRTIPLPGGCGLTGPGAYELASDALLAISSAGELRSTQNAEVARTIGKHITGRIAAHASAPDGNLIAWAKRPKTGRAAALHLYPDPSAVQYISTQFSRNCYLAAPMHLADDIESWTIRCGLSHNNVEFNRNEWSSYIDPITSFDVWTATGESRRNVELKSPCFFLNLAISADGRLVASLGSEILVLTDMKSGITHHAFQVSVSQTVYDSVGFSPGDDLIVAAQARTDGKGWRSSLTAWETATGRQAWSWDAQGLVGAFTFSPDGQLVAALDTDGTIAVFDVKSQQALPTIGTHGEANFPCLAFSPDGSRLAVSGDRTVKVWGLP
jgi:WD40 repeat protein